MLSAIRNKIKGWVAYVIIALIIVPFALFGVSEYFTGTSNIVVASVNGDDISKGEFLPRFEGAQRRLQKKLGDKYPAELNRDLKLSVIRSMIDGRVLAQLASKLGYVVTKQELQEFIQSSDIFKEEGKFSIEKYKRLLRLNGYSDIGYEQLQIKELLKNQIKYNFLNSAFLTPLMLNRMQSLNDQQRKFSYIQLNTKDYLDKAEISVDSIKKVYESEKETFLEPQKVKVDFVTLSLEKVAKDTVVSEADLLSFYEEEKQRFSTEEERKVQHILVESEVLANKLVEQIKQGEDFAKLAIKHSKDAGSKDSGGDLGFFTIGAMVPEFEAKAFSMKEGEVSAPVKSDFGYHIIKLNKIKAATAKPFEEVRDELSKTYTEQMAQKTIYNLTEQLGNLAYEASLEEVAEQMNLKLETSDFFAQDSMMQNRIFMTAAYSDVVLNKGENSELLEISKGSFVVLRLNEKVAERQQTFDEVESYIKKRLVDTWAKEFVKEIADKIADSFIKGDIDAAKALMSKNKLTWKDVDWATRSSRLASASIIKHIFSLPKPNDGAIYSTESLDQQAVVLKLSEVKTPKNEPNRSLPGRMLNIESDEVFRSILETLKEDSSIEIFESRL
ncbi:Parvulin-like peptidyl-prolyl isomerase [Bathymodiolus thermophilus thioautotrophic gill symbiont]|uniref:Periplasmic chaperone PpiD n=1 Tax=Bathymodiolus thermophilus thioautotrophic gill symbiont TaxID=2360 RepID=A0A3G3IKV3_9GAMM|nr:SurA N-terminal domain-containing protein [Bathymodiolus thermophilus thioautotrophic gill symbiont]AYQ56483.1 Parvulin-like peptidyl-prolyl isomerase [Bathymodiolus thermophilus thioautotrophic gill symbiont]